MVAVAKEQQTATGVEARSERDPAQSCVIYSRGSSDEQAKGYSLSTQEESCRRYCADHGYTIVGVFHDAHSGTELDRPGLNAAIEAIDALKPTVVLLHDVDRLGREIIVQAIAERDLTRHGARIEYVLGGGNATPEQELLKMMKQGIAVYENRQRVERSRRGKDGRVRDGHVLVAARPAYGYRYIGGKRTGTLEPHPDEAPIVQRIFTLCADEGLTCYEIAKRLCREEVPSRADADSGIVRKRAPHYTWNPHTIAGMLRNETYKGTWHWGKTRRVRRGDRIVQEPRPREEWLSLPVTPLVDDATWDRAQAQVDRNRTRARRNTQRKYLLRGLIFCPSCGRRWYARYKGDIDRCYYRCPSARAELWAPGDCMIRFSLEQQRLESAVLAAIKAFLLDPETRAAGISAEQHRLATERQCVTDDLATIDRHLAAVDQRLGKLLDEALTCGFPDSIIDQRKRDLLTERERHLREREQALGRLANTDTPDIEAAIAALVPTVEQAFSLATHEDLRRLLEVLRVEIHVVDRDTVRLSGVVGGHKGSNVTLSLGSRRRSPAGSIWD